MSTHPSTPTTDAFPTRIATPTPSTTLIEGVAACQQQFDPWNTHRLPNRTDETNAAGPGVASP